MIFSLVTDSQIFKHNPVKWIYKNINIAAHGHPSPLERERG
jgi:hypothetical protein